MSSSEGGTIDLGKTDVPPEVLEMVPPQVAAVFRVVPVAWDSSLRTLTLASADPDNLNTVDDLSFFFNCRIVMLRSTEAEVEAAIDRLYPPDPTRDLESLLAELAEEGGRFGRIRSVLGRAWRGLRELWRRGALGDDSPEVKCVMLMIADAAWKGASGFTLSPDRDGYSYFRGLDSERPAERYSRGLGLALVARLKRMARATKPRPGEVFRGVFRAVIMGRELECRVEVSTLPEGERAVVAVVPLPSGPQEKTGPVSGDEQ